MNLNMFLSKITDNENLFIFLLSLAFLLGVVVIWIVIYLIAKRVKEDKHYKKLAREELESLGIELDTKKTKDDTDEPIIIDLTKDEEPQEEVTTETSETENLESTEETIVDEETVEEIIEEEVTEVEEVVEEEESVDVDTIQEEVVQEEINTEEEATETEEVVEESQEVSSEEAPTIEFQEEVVDEPTIEEIKPVKKGRTYNGKYEIFQVADGFAYHLKASNGEILVTSETYRSRDGVLKAIDAVKRNLETGEVRIFADKRGKYKFKLVSRNYRVLAISSNYSVEKSAVRAAESFKKFAVKADIVDIELVDKDAKTATIIEITTTEDRDDGRFVIEKFDGEYSWDLKASNGQILCQAEGYTSKAGCLYSIDTFKRNVELGVFKCIKDKNGRYCYKLYAPNGRVCAIGESYNTRSGAESAANSVVAYFKLADIVEVKS